MITALLTALVMGAIGSMHCVGMCGPLALMLPFQQLTLQARFISALLYNIGRMITYGVLGLIAGSIAHTAVFFGYQQWLSITAGLLILCFVWMPRISISNAAARTTNSLMSEFRNLLSRFFTRQGYSSSLFTGMLNGLMPCGLVYMALAGAMSTGTVYQSGLFMMVFGMGTLPAMWALIFFGNTISVNVRQQLRKWYPVLMSLAACMLIIRGMGLNIPYLSPLFQGQSPTINCQ
ncbi:MAG: sulfite exporter TauE/SafE family protein [Ferruginibacter sp.]